jgi:hypothetical protein
MVGEMLPKDPITGGCSTGTATEMREMILEMNAMN